MLVHLMTMILRCEVCGFLSGWVEASLGATLHGDCFTADQELISLSCAQTELKGCQPNVNTMLSTQCCQPNV